MSLYLKPGFFFKKNNYKTQTILLVRQRFKHIWFLTIRVQMTQFLGYKSSILPAAEVDKVSKSVRNQVHWTRFLYIEIESFGLGFCS